MRLSEAEYKRLPEHLKAAFVCVSAPSEVEAAFAAFGERGAGGKARVTTSNEGRADERQYRIKPTEGTIRDHGDVGTASRFFYSAKASRLDRSDSKHPTIKPINLLRWLVRLVCPPGGTVLDPFAGSGTTLAAATLEGFNAIGIEQSEEYVADIQRRLAALKSAPTEDLPPLLAAMAAE